MECPKCKSNISSESKECPECGVIIAKVLQRKAQPPPRPPAPNLKETKRRKKIRSCPDCEQDVSINAKNCPHCGAVLVHKSRIGCFSLIIVFFLISAALQIINKDDPEDSKSSLPVTKTIGNTHNQKTPDQIAANKAERERKEAEEYERCKTDLACWGEKYYFDATLNAQYSIEQGSVYQVKWLTGSTYYGYGRVVWKDRDKLTITCFGDKLQIQNQYGAWVNHIYEIDYDPINKEIFNIKIRPGKL